jgi:hypothetical protein
MDARERRKLYRNTERPRCSAMLKLPFPVQCSRRASVARDGRPYCGLHDPRRQQQRKATEGARGRSNARQPRRKGKR